MTNVTAETGSTALNARIDYRNVSPEAMRAMAGLERFVQASGLESRLVELVKLCASYLNGRAYCVDVHTKDARVAGETEQRLYSIPGLARDAVLRDESVIRLLTIREGPVVS